MGGEISGSERGEKEWERTKLAKGQGTLEKGILQLFD